MASLFNGDVVVITGAGRGIGAAAAHLFAQHGARVVVSDRDAAPTEAVVASITAAGGEAIGIPGDVTDKAFPEMILGKTIETWGKLNVLVNNAGYTWDAVLHKMTDEQWDAMMEVHANAVFRMIRAAAPYMREAAKAEMSASGTPEPRSIINISSTSGLHGNAGQASYALAKAGLLGLTKTVAKEWGQFGVRCNAVAFGMIDTRLTQSKEAGETIEVDGKPVQLGIPENLRGMISMMIPLGRPGTPEEAAGGIVMMASPLAAYISGHTLEVTGGMGI